MEKPSQKSYQTILEQEITEGLRELERSVSGLFISGLSWSIGIAHMHHAVVGSVEGLAGIFARQGVTFADFGHFLIWTTLGNAAGGVFLVALFKYGHVIRGGSEPAEVNLEKPASVIIDSSST